MPFYLKMGWDFQVGREWQYQSKEEIGSTMIEGKHQCGVCGKNEDRKKEISEHVTSDHSEDEYLVDIRKKEVESQLKEQIEEEDK